VAGTPERVDLCRPHRLIEISKIQRIAMAQYSPHFFEKGELLVRRQRMEGQRADHFVE